MFCTFGFSVCVVEMWARAESVTQDIVDVAVSAGSFETLVAAVQAGDLVDTLKARGPLTVFAPTDDAFRRLPEGTLETLLKPENKEQLVSILTYHVIPGRVSAAEAYGLDNASTVNGQRLKVSRRDGRLVVGDANITATDIPCTNGVIHVIDRVLLPEYGRIPAVAEQAGSFSTLLAAAAAADLVDVLGSDGPFTVFAPTDDAFGRLPDGKVETLLEDENRNQLVDILKYHVVSGRIYSEQAAAAGRASTLQGQSLETSVTANGLQVNDARVVQADLDTANGVIHVIDAVLLPEPMNPRQAMSVLTEAINRGVPIYNRGHHRQCAEIYMAACQMIVDSGSNQLPEHVVTTLNRTMDRAKHIHHSSQRAWALRHGMDEALSSLRLMTLVSTD
ncbi:MAG: fasciclin domain-containing protein [Planctomycetes bacterium]|nr:fasciclin domain-containing protein [Planctomycetota bacterium]